MMVYCFWDILIIKACNYKISFFLTLVLQDALFDIAIAHKATPFSDQDLKL